MHILHSYIRVWMMMKIWKMTKVVLNSYVAKITFIAMVFFLELIQSDRERKMSAPMILPSQKATVLKYS
jgi:hypothetical protein